MVECNLKASDSRNLTFLYSSLSSLPSPLAPSPLSLPLSYPHLSPFPSLPSPLTPSPLFLPLSPFPSHTPTSLPSPLSLLLSHPHLSSFPSLPSPLTLSPLFLPLSHPHLSPLFPFPSHTLTSLPSLPSPLTPSPLFLPSLPSPLTPSPLTPSQEIHLREIGINIVGDRIIFMEYLKLLKKHKRDADRSRSLWNATTPVLSLAYHHNCGEFCFQVSV